MEFCPGGDLRGLMGDGLGLLEEDLWDCFLCLCASVGVMARGTEDWRTDARLHGEDTRSEIVHHE